MIKVLIVDDSKFIRFNLEQMLSKDQEIEVVGSVGNGIEAIRFLEMTPVDAIILDFFMPKMDGLATLEHVMERFPTPTIMLTLANRKEHADLFFKALRLGAFEILTKPTGSEELHVENLADAIIQKVHQACEAKEKIISIIEKDQFFKDIEQRIDRAKDSRCIESGPQKDKKVPVKFEGTPAYKLVIIGASTGGPHCVFSIVQKLRRKHDLSVLIVQHMPAGFTTQFAERLDKVADYKAFEPSDKETMKAGIIYVAPGDFHTTVEMNENNHVVINLDKREKVMGLRPCIDYSMVSAAPIFKNQCFGIILSGMGQDGVDGVEQIKEFGGTTIAQSPAEALISSMPDHAIKRGVIDHVLTIDQIATYINQIA